MQINGFLIDTHIDITGMVNLLPQRVGLPKKRNGRANIVAIKPLEIELCSKSRAVVLVSD